MRRTLMALTLLAVPIATALGDGIAGDAQDLRKVVMAELQPAIIETAFSERGCGPVGCSIDIDGLSILRERKMIQPSEGEDSEIRLKQHAPGGPKNLPEMDWEPIAGFKVFRAGRRWGTCIEFGHAGVGKSGRYQRWISVVLVPWKGSRPNSVAHRFVGYWAGCDSLAEGIRPGEIILPIIEPVATAASRLRIVLYHCIVERCIPIEDARSVNGDPNSESGALVINRK